MPVVPITTYTQLAVDPDSTGTPIGIQAPTEPGADPSDLTITVKVLPENGTVSLNGNALSVGQTMSVDDLTSLTFTPDSYNQTYDFIYTVTDTNSNSVDGAASLAIIGDADSPVLSTPDVLVAPGVTTALGLQAPVNNQEAATTAIIVDSLPSTGTITLADGTTAITTGEELTADQLTGLLFTPASGVSDVCDTFTYDVFNYPVGYGTGTVTLSIGAAGTPSVSSPDLSVTADTPTALGISAPSDPDYAGSDLTITVTGLPSNGTVTLADGTTALTDGETLSLGQLTGLLFTPENNVNATSAFTYSVADPAGNVNTGVATLAVNTTDDPVVSSRQVSVIENVPESLGLSAPSDPDYDASTLTITVTGLPSNGTITLADGTTAVSLGETLSAAQLTGLLFTPAQGEFDASSAFTYAVANPADETTNGSATVTIGAAVGNPTVFSPSLTVDENAGPTPLGIQTPTDPNYDSAQLVVTVFGVPTNGTVTLANGTVVGSGDTLSTGELTGLLFTPTNGYSNVRSAFDYLVSDPDGNSSQGSAVISVGIDAGNPVVYSPNVPVTENTQTPLSIPAPTDPNYEASDLTVTVAGLPANGTVTLADGATAVIPGETLSIAQLTGLLFTPNPGVFYSSGNFTYSVADPDENSSTGVVTLEIGGPIGNPVVSSPNIPVVENTPVALGLSAPADPNYSPGSLTITVTGLPGNGRVTLADGTTAVTSGETLSIAQLTGLLFTPTPGLFNSSSTFTYSAADPAANSSVGTATLAIGNAVGNPTVSSPNVSVTENTPTALGISAPSDPNFSASSLTITVAALPDDGTVTLADGITAVTSGETLSIAQLTGLLFDPTPSVSNTSGTFQYTVDDPAGNSATGTATPSIAATVDSPTASSTNVGVAENTDTALGLSAPSDPNYDPSDLTITVTGLPSNGEVTLADGTTVVTSGETLSISQLTGLLFAPPPNLFNASSTFSYTVSDPGGQSTVGSATVSIGPAIGNPIVSSPALTVSENAAPTPLGIQAPTDPNYSSSALVIAASSLPNDGTISLANGTPVVSGESLTVGQLTGLTFTPTDEQFNQTSSFTYTVADPAGNSSTGTVSLSIGPSLDVDPSTSAALPTIDPDLNGTFEITNVGAARAGGNNGTSNDQFVWPGTQSIAIRAGVPDVFIQGGPAGDAIEVTSGSNVLDGGGGSNFLVGATGFDGGTDQFYVDASGSGVTWNTLVNFHPGDSVTIWGFQQGVSTDAWTASAGAAGYHGATLNFAMAGAETGVNASLTFAAITQQDATSKLAMTTGTDNGRSYLQITYTS